MADRSMRRWLPAIVAPIVVIGGALAVPLTAGAAGVPPEKSAQEVLELVGSNEVTALSGTVVQTSELGLPDLSGALSGTGTGGDSASSALELLTGSHTARVYLDEAQGARVQILDRMAERDIIAGPDGVWFYDSGENTATHLALPELPAGGAAGGESTDRPQSDATDAVPTPAAVAEHFLDAIEPSTAVSVDNTSVVAGRSAYDLVLTPNSADTLIAAVTIAVDSETGLPLSVAVTAKGQSTAAFSVAFSDISFDTPDASLFSFTPPAGATVDEQLPHAFSLSASAAGEHDSHLGDLARERDGDRRCMGVHRRAPDRRPRCGSGCELGRSERTDAARCSTPPRRRSTAGGCSAPRCSTCCSRTTGASWPAPFRWRCCRPRPPTDPVTGELRIGWHSHQGRSRSRRTD